jgi:hypothetical protein
VRSLCRAVWLNHDPERCYLAVYFAYYDASGNQDHESALIVAAVVAREDKWLKMELAWKRHLAAFDVPYVHMKEFAGGAPFAALRADHVRQKLFFDGLQRLSKTNLNKVFLKRIVPSDFEAMRHEYDVSLMGGAYAIAAHACIAEVEMWIAAKGDQSRVLHIVEQGDVGQSGLMRLQALEANPAVVRPKLDPVEQSHFVPFQVADWFAYEHAVDVRRRLANDKRNRRASVIAQRLNVPISATMIDQEILRLMCEDNPELLPRRNAERPSSQV